MIPGCAICCPTLPIDRHAPRRRASGRRHRRPRADRRLWRLRRRWRDGGRAAATLPAQLGLRPKLYVPDRLREGYGPNALALRALAAAAVSLVITVDCGIGAHDALADAAEGGLDVIVVDHHQASLPLPPAVAIIDPKRPDDRSGLDHLCAAGLAFLLIVDTNRLLRASGYYAARPEPDLRQWLDLVALGTVCDVVPLEGVNCAFVAQGLKIMARRGNAGLAAIADAAGLRRPPSARDLGFAIGPRINAGGRIGQADLGARLLSCDDPAEAVPLAARLHALNRERQEIEQSVWVAAAGDIGDVAASAPLIWATGEGWHPGVVGIVASRLAEHFRRPAVVVAIAGERATASGRSVPEQDLGAAIGAAMAAGLLVKGGHAMAGGFTAETRRLDQIREFMNAHLVLDDAVAEGLRALPVDGVLSLAGAAALPTAALARLAPFGAGHPEPRFLIPAVQIAHIRQAGNAHLCCGLLDGARTRLPAIAFRCADRPLGRGLIAHGGGLFHVTGRLQPCPGAGSSLQLVIDDAAPALCA
ncbi:MAG: DHHA1 domain-containing protein [Rhodospirillales bacterium]